MIRTYSHQQLKEKVRKGNLTSRQAIDDLLERGGPLVIQTSTFKWLTKYEKKTQTAN